MNPDVINYAFGIIGTIIGIASLVFAVRTIKKKEPVYHISSNNLISAFSPQYKGLKISYKNKRIEYLTVSKIAFFNRGAEIINQDDIETINHVRIVAKDNVTILDAMVLNENNPSSQFKINFDKEKNHVLLNFSYLSKNQGAAIQVMHTGLSSHDIEIEGDIKDVAVIKRISRDIEASSLNKVLFQNKFWRKIVVAFIVLTPIIIFIGSTWSLLSPVTFKAFTSLLKPFSGIISIIFPSVLLTLSIYVLHDLWGFMSQIAPEGLEEIDYEDVLDEKINKIAN
jgi:hypothetical protein